MEDAAVGVEQAFGLKDGVIVWDLEEGRGIETLRGLFGRITKVIFPPDGRFVAALANDWRVGVWDRTEARLLAVLEVEPGLFMDNATLALSPDGRSLAFSGGHKASLWGARWPVAPGLVIAGGFARILGVPRSRAASALPDGNRVRQGRSLPPFQTQGIPQSLPGPQPPGARPAQAIGRDHGLQSPRVHCRRDPRWRFRDHRWARRIAGAAVRAVRVYNGRTGRQLGSIPTKLTSQRDHAAIRIDPTGKTATVFVGSRLNTCCSRYHRERSWSVILRSCIPSDRGRKEGSP